MKIFAAAFLLLLLAGCASAVISDIAEDKVIVQRNIYTDQEQVLATANEGCALYGRTAVPISERCLNQYCTVKAALFACKPDLD